MTVKTDFIMRQYGYVKLFKITDRSGWIECKTLDEFIYLLLTHEAKPDFNSLSFVSERQLLSIIL